MRFQRENAKSQILKLTAGPVRPEKRFWRTYKTARV